MCDVCGGPVNREDGSTCGWCEAALPEDRVWVYIENEDMFVDILPEEVVEGEKVYK